MSASISKGVGGKVNFKSFDGKAAWWDVLGEHVSSEAATLTRAIKEGGLDYLLEKTPCGNFINGEWITVPDRWNITRMDTGDVLYNCGAGYTPIQNEDALAFAEFLVQEGAAVFHTIGAIGKGERIFASLKNPKGDYSVKGNRHESYVNVANSHDGTLRLIIAFGDFRIECRNTFNAFLRTLSDESIKFTTKHTKNAAARMAEMKKNFAEVLKHMDDVKEKMLFLSTKQMSVRAMESFFDTIIGVTEEKLDEASAQKRKQRDLLFEILETNANECTYDARGTAYEAFNVISYYTDHLTQVRKTNGRDEVAARATSSIFGSGQKMKEKAMKILLTADGKEIIVPEETRVETSLLDNVLAVTN